MTSGSRSGFAALGLVAATVAATSVPAADPDPPPLGHTAVARPAAEWGRDGKLAKLDFDFGDFKAWVRRDGSWHAEGAVQHRGLRCGTYTLLMRVGHGDPGCSKVRWFGEPRAVASVTLCNSARGLLSGSDTRFRGAARFDQITCGERAIACDGNCR